MPTPFDVLLTVADPSAYLVRNARLPIAVTEPAGLAPAADGLANVDIAISGGRISEIRPTGSLLANGRPVVDVDRGIVLPLFVDMHTHLDKGHILPRRRNPDGRFASALAATASDRERHWNAADVGRRMDFALRCAFAHGTRAIRTHIDSVPPQDEVSWPVLSETREEWAGRIDLQAVSLVGPDAMLDRDGLDAIARRAKVHGGILGGAVADFPGRRQAVANVVSIAAAHGLDLDLHVDETEDRRSRALLDLTEEVLEQGFAGRVVAGHCCSLAVQDGDLQDRTLDRVAEAGIAVVSLPMCNMYLQDRHLIDGDDAGTGPRRTPRWRGVTLLHEMRARGIPVAVASDNTRDPFHAYGDLDGIEVMREATRILHLDHPSGEWMGMMSRMPANIIGAEGHGRIAANGPADFIALRARDASELHSRPQADRVVVRDGRVSAAELPDYRQLDDLFGVAT
jgi:cytosine/creatinine deaminase